MEEEEEEDSENLPGLVLLLQFASEIDFGGWNSEVGTLEFQKS